MAEPTTGDEAAAGTGAAASAVREPEAGELGRRVADGLPEIRARIADLDERLDTAWVAGRTAWPDLPLPPETWAHAVADHLRRVGDGAADWLSTMRPDDLYLAISFQAAVAGANVAAVQHALGAAVGHMSTSPLGQKIAGDLIHAVARTLSPSEERPGALHDYDAIKPLAGAMRQSVVDALMKWSTDQVGATRPEHVLEILRGQAGVINEALRAAAEAVKQKVPDLQQKLDEQLKIFKKKMEEIGDRMKAGPWQPPASKPPPAGDDAS